MLRLTSLCKGFPFHRFVCFCVCERLKDVSWIFLCQAAIHSSCWSPHLSYLLEARVASNVKMMLRLSIISINQVAGQWDRLQSFGAARSKCVFAFANAGVYRNLSTDNTSVNLSRWSTFSEGCFAF